MTATATAEDLRAKAAELRSRAYLSRKECGADGAMTQQGNLAAANEAILAAAIADRGGRWEFPALFDLTGNLVPARRHTIKKDGRTRYSWMLLTPEGRKAGWFNPSQAEDPARARANNAKRGYFVGRVLAPAKAELSGNHITTLTPAATRTDGGWSTDVEVVDNGQDAQDTAKAAVIARYTEALNAWRGGDRAAYAEMATCEDEAYTGGYLPDLFAQRGNQ